MNMSITVSLVKLLSTALKYINLSYISFSSILQTSSMFQVADPVNFEDGVVT